MPITQTYLSLKRPITQIYPLLKHTHHTNKSTHEPISISPASYPLLKHAQYLNNITHDPIHIHIACPISTPQIKDLSIVCSRAPNCLRLRLISLLQSRLAVSSPPHRLSNFPGSSLSLTFSFQEGLEKYTNLHVAFNLQSYYYFQSSYFALQSVTSHVCQL